MSLCSFLFFFSNPLSLCPSFLLYAYLLHINMSRPTSFIRIKIVQHSLITSSTYLVCSHCSNMLQDFLRYAMPPLFAPTFSVNFLKLASAIFLLRFLNYNSVLIYACACYVSSYMFIFQTTEPKVRLLQF